MSYFQRLVNFLLGRSPHWYFHQRTAEMRRWHDGRWEYRDPTPEEAEEAEWFCAIR